MQQQNGVYITVNPTDSDIKQHKLTSITKYNIHYMCLYFTVRQAVKQTWINYSDQYLFPDYSVYKDKILFNDSIIYSIFSDKNNFSYEYGINHWIPYSEKEVGAKENFKSNFLTELISENLKMKKEKYLFEDDGKINITGKLKFSKEAKDVLDSGRELWKYYHSIPRVNVNASFYDIKVYFKDGNMKNKSNDEDFNNLIGDLRDKMRILAKKFEPKIYEYGFLK